MSKRKTAKPGAHAPSPKSARFQRWVSWAYSFAAACLFALALAEFTNYATPQIRLLLMLGIMIAGTVAWVMEAKRKCPNCGQLYGYHFRLVRSNICRKCGAEYPKWRPGIDEDGSDDSSR